MPGADEVNPRVEGALGKLIELVERVRAGDLIIGDFYINASSSDPYRMNIEIKTVRGSAVEIVESAAQVKYAQPTDVAARKAEIAKLQNQIREDERKARADRDARNGMATRGPPDSSPRRRDWEEGDWEPQVPPRRVPGLPDWNTPPKPPKPALTDGARDLDLDFD